jgi:ribonuclease BN (tRNA processing enzyme)
MELTVLGSSDAFNGGGRMHASYLLRDGSAGPLAIDFGVTGLLALRRADLRGSELRGVLITHLHGDHFGGLPFLLLDGMYHDVRTAPLDLVGATGLGARLDALFGALYVDVAHRPRPFETRLAEMLPGDAREVCGFKVEAFAASHMDPPDIPLCFRVTGPSGRVVAFSGDTEPCDGLFAAATGADLLVAECSGLRPPCGRHITWVEWRELFAKSPSRRILLSHLSREVRASAEQLRAEAPADLELIFAEDGLVVPA